MSVPAGDRHMASRSPSKKLSVLGNAPRALERHDDKDWTRFERIAHYLRSLGELYS
jgi:putative transposase